MSTKGKKGWIIAFVLPPGGIVLSRICDSIYHGNHHIVL